jgi:nucleoid-associated protein YgaU
MGMRLEDRTSFENKNLEYIKKYRGKKKFINQLATQELVYPTQAEINEIKDYTFHTWTTGDTYAKLGYKYYSDPQLWWVIATINKKPTEFDLKVGDVLFVPTILSEAMSLIG